MKMGPCLKDNGEGLGPEAVSDLNEDTEPQNLGSTDPTLFPAKGQTDLQSWGSKLGRGSWWGSSNPNCQNIFDSSMCDYTCQLSGSKPDLLKTAA